MSAYVSVHLQRQVRSRFENGCAYCRTAENLAAATFEVEHITPRVAGGKTEFANLCLACPTCNRFKSSRTTFVDPMTQQVTQLFHPQSDIWTDHFQWNADFTELGGIASIGRATISALRMNRPNLIRLRRMWVAMNEHPPNP